MIKTFLCLVILASFSSGLLAADPSKKKSSKNSKKADANSAKIVPATPLASGWSLVNGVWLHSDGYKFVNGQVVRSSAQTHMPAPKPPTQADQQAATAKKPAAKTPAQIEAEKAAQRERNLAPRPASQTGSHL